jgi:hypothetical protein
MQMTPPNTSLPAAVRPTALSYALRALGRNDLPAQFVLAGARYRLAMVIKHDFYAATGFYDDDAGRRVVLKIGRVAPFMGVPMQWLGQWLCRREMRFYRALADLPAVPELLGRLGDTGFIHDFVPGRPLAGKRPPVDLPAASAVEPPAVSAVEPPLPDGYFDALMSLMEVLHRRGIAYVDTNKPQNILLGDDGNPHLIDFQISVDLHFLGHNFIGRALLRRFAREDVYHLLKHKKRLREDLLTPQERHIVEHKSWAVHLHRLITWPYFRLRRRFMRHLRDKGQLIEAGSD